MNQEVGEVEKTSRGVAVETAGEAPDLVSGQPPYEDLARAIIKKVAKSAITLAVVRHGLCNDFGGHANSVGRGRND
jgi:hypothetical protein